MNKLDLYSLATANGVPTPGVLVPRTRDEVAAFGERAAFPVMIKGIDPTRQHGKTKLIAATPQEVLRCYGDAEGLEPPNLMIQEYIPGSDASGWTFYGYFDTASACVAGFTARKIRLAPAYTGVISLGTADDNEIALSFCRRFMSAVGYRGVVNIGGKYDHRDGLYKVLDVNPRLGASFRLCASDTGFDVVRILYLHMTGQRVPAVRAQAGRKWLLEDDVFSAWTYLRKGELTFRQWLRSMRGVHELAWWARDDPLPFVIWSLSHRRSLR